MYVHELPTTGVISFADYVQSSGSTSRYTIEVARATEHRARLREVLKQNRHNASANGDFGDVQTGDWLRIVQAIEEYLPYLLALHNCIQVDEILLKQEPEFSWRTTLSSYLFKSSPRIALKGMDYELCAVLLLYGGALCNFAASSVTSLGSYELDRSLSNAERASRDDKLKQAADRFCASSGIFEYLSTDLVPKWEDAHQGRIDGRPPDLTREVTMALAKMSLADAQLLSIRKLLSSAVSEANDFDTPGPPLPKGHPSASLLAKLYLNVAGLYESASSLAMTVSKKLSSSLPDARKLGLDARDDRAAGWSGARGGNGLAGKLVGKFKETTGSGGAGAGSGSDEVGAVLLKYLSASACVAKAIAYKWLAIDAGENGERVGEAITFLRLAADEIQTKKERFAALGSAASGGKKGKSSRMELKTIQEQESRNIQHWLKAYMKLNDTVTFQPVPPASDLHCKIPAGRSVLNAKPFQPPEPKFGPKPGDRREASLHAVVQGLSDAHLGDDGTASKPSTPSKYAGANAYY